MRVKNAAILFLCFLMASPVTAKKVRKHSKSKSGSTETQRLPQAAVTSPDDLANFDRYPSDVKKLITDAFALNEQRLSYKFGSTDPENKGMDCSGTISYLLKQARIRDVPRQANEIYQWAWENGEFSAVNGHHFNTFEFSKLKPGDLLFWSGTYPVKRDPAITHVMMYLGRDKQNRPLMFGANSGGTYRGKSQHGVSVFDFNLPSANSKVRFLGYACIPHLTCEK